MTLMRNCLKDYCQTVHNPEYLAIDAISNSKPQSVFHQFNFNDFICKNNETKSAISTGNKLSNCPKSKTPETLNNTFLTNLSSSAVTESSSSSSNSVTSTTTLSNHVHNMNYDSHSQMIASIDNKQTYV